RIMGHSVLRIVQRFAGYGSPSSVNPLVRQVQRNAECVSGLYQVISLNDAKDTKEDVKKCNATGVLPLSLLRLARNGNDAIDSAPDSAFYHRLFMTRLLGFAIGDGSSRLPRTRR